MLWSGDAEDMFGRIVVAIAVTGGSCEGNYFFEIIE
jgi:hypothetical protein